MADANVPVAELVRSRSRDLLDNTAHTLRSGASLEGDRAGFGEAAGRELLKGATGLAKARVSRVPALAYDHLREEALARIPRDPDDWHTVALAMALDADIWTMDGDFLGCGVATWTTDTLATHLELHHR